MSQENPKEALINLGYIALKYRNGFEAKKTLRKGLTNRERRRHFANRPGHRATTKPRDRSSQGRSFGSNQEIQKRSLRSSFPRLFPDGRGKKRKTSWPNAYSPSTSTANPARTFCSVRLCRRQSISRCRRRMVVYRR